MCSDIDHHPAGCSSLPLYSPCDISWHILKFFDRWLRHTTPYKRSCVLKTLSHKLWVTSPVALFSTRLRSFSCFCCSLDGRGLYRLGPQSYPLLEISLTYLPIVNGKTSNAGERNTVCQVPFSHEITENIKQLPDSDIIHLSAAGMSLIILNSVKAANDLLDKRSSIYSNR